MQLCMFQAFAQLIIIKKLLHPRVTLVGRGGGGGRPTFMENVRIFGNFDLKEG
jgi:hypothetical protein